MQGADIFQVLAVLLQAIFAIQATGLSPRCSLRKRKSFSGIGESQITEFPLTNARVLL
jgi:hypothetical protein